MKYFLVSLAALAASAGISAASEVTDRQLARSSYDCDRFQSAQDMRMTKGALQACPDRFIRLRMQEENNKAGTYDREEPQKEEPTFSLRVGFSSAA